MVKPMRLRRLETALIGLALLLPLALPASGESDDAWQFEGGGWGHGLGLSQYGSQGMALDDYSAPEIIDFYYSGADVKSLQSVGDYEEWLDEPEAIWVGLASNQTARSFAAIGGPVAVCMHGDGTDDCASPDFTLASGQTLRFEVKADTTPLRCLVKIDGVDAGEGDCWADISWQENVASNRVRTGGILYARGSLHIRPNDSTYSDADRFHVILSVDLEDYIYGIAETLLRFEPAALEAQAIIARSYGVRRALNSADSSGKPHASRQDLCWCHIGSTSSDQNYDGWSGALPTEGDPVYGSRWRGAVDRTRNQVATHPQVNGGNSVISTFYSSSNGGASENNEDVWGGAPLPYLRSVADKWSADSSINPLARWSILVSDQDLATALGWDDVTGVSKLSGPPGALYEFKGIDGGTSVKSKPLSGTELRTILNRYGFRSDGASVRVSPYVSNITAPPSSTKPVPAPAPSGSGVFEDTATSVFKNAIAWMKEQKITLGCNPPDNNRYCPRGPVTRGEMGVFISRAIPLPPPTGDHFTDDSGEFWEGGANRMFEAKISVGCGGTRYCGDRNLPREQMAVFLVRALKLPPASKDYFIDDGNSQFEDHINRIAEAKITLGCNPPANDRFCPRDTVTRGEMAAFLKRAWGK